MIPTAHPQPPLRGSTKRAVEETLKSFVEFAHERFGAENLQDFGKREFRAFIEDGVSRDLAATTLSARVMPQGRFGDTKRVARASWNSPASLMTVTDK